MRAVSGNPEKPVLVTNGLGCGKNVVCADCPVRTRVGLTFRTGESIYGAEGRMTIGKGSEGAAVDMQISTALVENNGNNMVLVTIADITERKQAEEALRASEEKFRMAFWTSPDSININRASDGLYIDTNEGFSKITGYTREDVTGKTSLDLNIWEDPKDRERLVAELASKGFVANREARFRGKEGQIRTGLMSARISPLGRGLGSMLLN